MKNYSTSLKRIQKTFPKVEKVIDAKRPVLITVTDKDCKAASKKDPMDCALAKACKRQLSVDGVIIGISVSWLIKGTRAIRFKTAETVAREITSFDRHHDFAPGKNYRLSPMSPSDLKRGGKNKANTGTGKKLSHKVYRQHKTEDIRVLLK